MIQHAPQNLTEGVLTPETKDQIDSLLTAVGRAPQALLMLDYDGTLAPFRKDREQAVPYPGIPTLLRAIVRNGRTRVVIITGRDARDIIPLLDIDPCPEVWGLHGLQRMQPDGNTELSPLDKASLEGLVVANNWLIEQDLEHTAELKTGGIAVHWRGLNQCEAEQLRGKVMLGWTFIAKHSGLRLLEFDGGVEIRTPGADKGDAVQTILNEMNPGTPAAYLGDDNTDESAFQAVSGRGLSVLVRPLWRTTFAQSWLTPPNEVLDLLTRWLQACQEHDASWKNTATVNA